MTNPQYIVKIITSVDRIIVDSSTLMTPGFFLFFANNKELLCKAGKPIIVPLTAYHELKRMQKDNNTDAAYQAIAATELLATNEGLFSIESSPRPEEELMKLPQYIEIIEDLSEYRGDCNQLLITNNLTLMYQAVDLMGRRTYRGHRVTICNINKLGEMHNCVPKQEQEDEVIYLKTDVDDPTPSSKHNNMDIADEIKNQPKESHWKAGVTGLLGITLLGTVFLIGNTLLNRE